MNTLRLSEHRGHANLGWLDTKHSFSFGHYHDPAHMGFGALRVINEDIVEPGAGFDTHGHRDMEIVTYVLDGALEHKDSIGTGSVIRPGEVQRMTAGTGIRHSEFNASQSEKVKLLQIWILPETQGLAPGYEQKAFPDTDRQGVLRLLGSRDGRDGSVTIHQDVSLYGSLLNTGEQVTFDLKPGRKAWIQIANGAVTVGVQPLQSGDGMGLETPGCITITATSEAEFLLFDLAA
ncbi:MAG: pirin family protein [Alphaproteobacteria bacterium]